MNKIAFVDIDTQIDFIEPNGALYASGAEAIKPNLARLIKFSQQNSIPLVSSMDCHASDAKEFEVFPPHCVRDTDGQKKVVETRTGKECFVAHGSDSFPDPTTHHVVIEKDDFPVFTNPIAEAVFKAVGATHFYVFGVVTEVCVKAAALGLRERGYEVTLVKDAIWPITQADGDAALAEMQAVGIQLTTTEELLSSNLEVTAA